MQFLVYGLRDPRTAEIRYVGKSTSGLRRPREHGMRSQFDRERNHKARWIRSLVAAGLEYEIVVLEHCSSAEPLADAERRWIAIGRAALGRRFTNATDGGEGTVGRLHSEETRAKIAAAAVGRKPSAETRAKMSAASSRHQRKPEARAARSAAARERMRSPDAWVKQVAAMRTPAARAKISVAHKGRPKSPEHRLKIALARRRRCLPRVRINLLHTVLA